MRAQQTRNLAAVGVVLFGLVVSPSLALAHHRAPVRPILECVTKESPSQFTAVYGYKNENSVAVAIPVGENNKFSPPPKNRGQTTVFQPGRTPHDQGAFQVPFNGSHLVWSLKGPDGVRRTATASAHSKRCPGPTLTRLEPVSLSLAEGSSGTLTATISAAQASATPIVLTNSAPTVAALPTSVSVPAGALIASIPVTAVSPGTATITALLNGSTRESTITVLPAGPRVTSLLPANLPVAQGASGTLTVTLSAAQAYDTIVPLSASDPGVLGLPPGNSVTVPAGQLSQTVVVTGIAPGTATLVAGPLNGTCAQSQVTVTSPPPTVVSLAPPVLPLVEGSAGTLTVTLNASQPTDTEVAIATTDPTVVGLPGDRVTVPAHTLAAAFAITGLARGTATVTASLNGASATSAITVQPPPPTVSALACPAALTVGATGGCTVTLNATQLAETMVPLAGDAPAVLTVPASITIPAGQLAAPVPVVAVGPGIATVTAGPLNDTSRQATVQVQPPPPTLVGLTPSPATLLVGASTTLTLALNAAQVADTAVALASVPTGVVMLPPSITVPAGSPTVPIPVTALVPGTTTLTAGPLNGTTVEATVAVNQLPPTVTALTPAELTLPKGAAETLTVTIAPVQSDPTAVALASSDQAAVEVPASVPVPAGAATAAFPAIGRNVGTATVTAGPLNGTTAQTSVTVTPPALVALGVAPSAATLAVGQTQPFLATGAFTDGSTQDLTAAATWASSDDAIASVSSPGGVVTARAVGQATITVTAEGRNATATVTVTSPTLAVLALAPTLPTRSAGQTLQFQATGTYTDGTTQDLTATATWTSSNVAVATITSTGGLATALAAGQTTITATQAEGMTVTTTLTVTAPAVVGLTLSAANPNVTVGQQLQLIATGTFTNGTTQDLTTQVTWTSGAPLVASVSAAGLVSALTPGTTTVSATHASGVAASTTVTVLLPLPTLLRLEPEPLSIAQGGSGSLTATISTVQPGDTTIALTSSDPTVAAVPGTIVVPGGSLSAPIPVAGVALGTTTITATLNGSTLQGTVVVRAGVGLTSLLPATLSIRRGAAGSLMVALSKVQDTDTAISLTSSNPAIATVPLEGTVTVVAGQQAGPIAVAGISTGIATITAALNGSTVQSHVSVTDVLPTVASLDPPVLALANESTGTITVTLDATQPTDTEVHLATSDASAVSLPLDRVIVSANTPSATFTVAPADGGLAAITASLNGSSVSTAVLAWWSLPGVKAIACPGAVAEGATARCVVTLNYAQPTDTETPLATSGPQVLSVPVAVTIPAGSDSGTFGQRHRQHRLAPLADLGALGDETQAVEIDIGA